MKKLLFAFNTAFIVTFMTACSPVNSVEPFDQKQAETLLREHYTSARSEQMVALVLPQKNRWKKVDLSLEQKGAPVMLVPRYENTEHWSESIRTFILSNQNRPDATPKMAGQKQIENSRSTCQACYGGLINASDNSALYELHLSHCDDHQQEIQYGKTIKGKDAIYTVYYSADPAVISPNQLRRMQHAIQSAYLIDNPEHIRR